MLTESWMKMNGVPCMKKCRREEKKPYWKDSMRMEMVRFLKMSGDWGEGGSVDRRNGPVIGDLGQGGDVPDPLNPLR
jgi:hypothetical protein